LPFFGKIIVGLRTHRVHLFTMCPLLNWREIAILAEAFHPELSGMFVEKLFIPERPLFPDGYIKGEWAIRFSCRHNELTLLFSVRARHPYFALHSTQDQRSIGGRGTKQTLKSSSTATRSPFDLALSKHIKGARFISLNALPRERVVTLWFSALDSDVSVEQLGLVLVLIPAAPEALLVKAPSGSNAWPILARSRAKTEAKAQTYLPPDGIKAPSDLPIHEEYIQNPLGFFNLI
jgi:hypothetical protein